MRALLARHGAVLLLVLLLVAAYETATPRAGMFQWDEAEYATLGRSLLRGEGFSIAGEPNYYRLPVVPAGAAIAMGITGSSDDRVVARATLAFAALALVIVYAFARAEHGAAAGVAAAAFLGVQPVFWRSTAFLMTEIPFLAFFSAALFALHRGLTRDTRCLIASAAFAALALATRYTAVLLGPLALLFVLGWLATGGMKRSRELLRGRHLWIAIALGVVLVAPWLLRQQIVFGDALTGFRYASGQLGAYLPGVSMPWHFYLTHFIETTSPIVAAFAVVGAGLAVYRRDSFAILCLLASLFILIWFSVYRFKEVRQVTSMMPFVAVLAAYGLTRLLDEETPRRGALVAAALAIAFTHTAWTVAPRGVQYVTLGYPSFLNAMKDLRERSGPSDLVIAAPVPQVAWYADRTVRGFPERDRLDDELARAAWVVVTNFERGQPSYAIELLGTLETNGRREQARVFRDRRFWTALVPAPALAQ